MNPFRASNAFSDSRDSSGSRGSASIEMAAMVLPVFAIFAVMVMAGRLTLAQQAADAAAYDAARTASLATAAGAAESQAKSAALASFTSQGIACTTQPDVKVNTDGFAQDVGQAATVRVTVSCQVLLSDVAFPGMPGAVTLSSSFVSPLDKYRSRS